MSWFIDAAVARGLGSAYAARHAQLEAQRRANEILAISSGIDSYQIGRPGTPIHVTSKCPGCGSHEWRQHNSVRICAYCRSEQ